jgi:toxin ParE1/3/4
MRILWSRRAIANLTALRDYIAEDSPASAAMVAQRVLTTIEMLAKQPQIGRPGRIAGTRELIVPGTPYIVPYRVRGDKLELIAVFHGRQNWPTHF